MGCNPRVIGPASEIPEADRYCTCCERPLRTKVAWLELDQRTDTYHDRGGVPTDKSQGWFPFGLGCARSLLKQADGCAAAAPEEPQEPAIPQVIDCRVCGRAIASAELCETCAEGNDPFFTSKYGSRP